MKYTELFFKIRVFVLLEMVALVILLWTYVLIVEHLSRKRNKSWNEKQREKQDGGT